MEKVYVCMSVCVWGGAGVTMHVGVSVCKMCFRVQTLFCGQ